MSVYKRKSGRYAVLVDLEPTALGGRRRKSVGMFRTRKETEAAERKALEARDRGIDLSPKTISVAQLLDRFIADRRAKGRALRTVMRYDEFAKFRIAPHIGGIALANVPFAARSREGEGDAPRSTPYRRDVDARRRR